MTLVDLSPEMLTTSCALNPECEHLPGDMRTVRLGRLFDAVFIHDAIIYWNLTNYLTYKRSKGIDKSPLVGQDLSILTEHSICQLFN